MAIRRYYPSGSFRPNTASFKEAVSVDRWDSPSLKLLPNRIQKRLPEYQCLFRNTAVIVPLPDMPTIDSQPYFKKLANPHNYPYLFRDVYPIVPSPQIPVVFGIQTFTTRSKASPQYYPYSFRDTFPQTPRVDSFENNTLGVPVNRIAKFLNYNNNGFVPVQSRVRNLPLLGVG